MLIAKKSYRDEQKNQELAIAKENFEIEKAERLAALDNKTDDNLDGTNKFDNDNNVDMNDEPEYDDDGNLIEKKINKDEFDEKTWLANWENDKSVIEIPEEIELDEDNDIDIDIEKIIEQEKFGG